MFFFHPLHPLFCFGVTGCLGFGAPEVGTARGENSGCAPQAPGPPGLPEPAELREKSHEDIECAHVC